jgi:hypothetical protein
MMDLKLHATLADVPDATKLRLSMTASDWLEAQKRALGIPGAVAVVDGVAVRK